MNPSKALGILATLLVGLFVVNLVTDDDNLAVVSDICHGNGCVLQSPDNDLWGVNPRDIHDMCATNGLNCRHTYDGKRARITGKFRSLDRPYGADLKLVVGDDKRWLSSVWCFIDPGEYIDNFYNYRSGDEIYIEGIIDIDTVGVKVDECRIISELPSA